MSKLSAKVRFSTAEIVIATIVVFAVCFLGYTFYTRNQEKKAAESSAVSDVPTPPTITTDTDLDKAATTIDETQVELDNSEDLSELDKELDEF
jgi:flagellar basal body-associated protein FliL